LGGRPVGSGAGCLAAAGALGRLTVNPDRALLFVPPEIGCLSDRMGEEFAHREARAINGVRVAPIPLGRVPLNEHGDRKVRRIALAIHLHFIFPFKL